jgi:hypothetical protein
MYQHSRVIFTLSKSMFPSLSIDPIVLFVGTAEYEEAELFPGLDESSIHCGESSGRQYLVAIFE